MGVVPKPPSPKRLQDPPRPAEAENVSPPSDPTLTTPAVAISSSERSARQTIVRYRQSLDWVLHVPEFERPFEQGLNVLGMPEPRRGIGLRALLDSMMIEAKKDLLLWVLEQFRGSLPGPTAQRLAEVWGLPSASCPWLSLDQPLSGAHWTELGDLLRPAIQREHRRYKDAQQELFSQLADLPEKLAARTVYDPAKRADACQEGCLGLLHAIDKVDDGETPLSGYAQQWVGRAIRNYLLGERFPVHVPVNLASSLLREASRAAPGAKEPVRPERSLLQPHVCLDQPPTADSRPMALTDESTPGPRDLLNKHELLRMVQDMINQLSDKQREVLERRYGLGPGCEAETLMNIAQSIGISHQQVSMREKRALEKLGSIMRPVYRELYG